VPDTDTMASGSETASHGDDCHHGTHVHPAFNMILPDRVAGLANQPAGLPPQFHSTSFTSHFPPLFDRPPAVRG